jgi:hypothetical protein
MCGDDESAVVVLHVRGKADVVVAPFGVRARDRKRPGKQPLYTSACLLEVPFLERAVTVDIDDDEGPRTARMKRRDVKLTPEMSFDPHQREWAALDASPARGLRSALAAPPVLTDSVE